MPVSHLTLTVSHLPTSTSFFLSCLQPLGYQFIGRQDEYIGFGQKQGGPADFWLTEQKPGVPASAAHVAFPAPSKDAVGSFFVSALKAGGKIHGEPKTRDALSGYYSAAVIDFDGNSIEAVFRPESASAPSVGREPTMALLEKGSAVSKVSSKARSRAVSKAPTIVEQAALSVSSRHSQSTPPPYISPTAPKSDDGSKTARTIVGTLIGAAAGAAIAYAMVKGDAQSSSSAETHNPPPQYGALAYSQTQKSSQAASQDEEDLQPTYRAIEAPPPRSVYSQSGARSTFSRNVSSKNPHASTIYEGSEFIVGNEPGRRASEGSGIIYSAISELPLRAIEYPPPSNAAQQRQPCSPSTFISSYAVDKPGGKSRSAHSVHSSSSSSPTIKASPSTPYRRHSHDDRDSYSKYTASHHSHQSTSKLPHSKKRGSMTSSTLTARNVPLPASAAPSSSISKSGGCSYVSARAIPLPESVVDLELESQVTPDDSISQVGSRRGVQSTHSPTQSQSHRSSRSKHGSRASSSKPSSGGGGGATRSKFEEGVILPSDSVSQVSSRASRRTVKAAGGGGGDRRSKAASRVGGSSSNSRRGSQVV